MKLMLLLAVAQRREHGTETAPLDCLELLFVKGITVHLVAE